MLDTLKGLWARLEVRWHAIAIALVAAVPEALDKLGVIDLRPILGMFMSYDKADALMGLLPLVLLFLKPALNLAEHPEDAEK